MTSHAPSGTFHHRTARVASHRAMQAKVAASGPTTQSFVRPGFPYPSTDGAAMSHTPSATLTSCAHTASPPRLDRLARVRLVGHAPERAPHRPPGQLLALQVLEAGEHLVHRRADHDNRDDGRHDAERAPPAQDRLQDDQEDAHRPERADED